jgi:hypothetical protein
LKALWHGAHNRVLLVVSHANDEWKTELERRNQLKRRSSHGKEWKEKENEKEGEYLGLVSLVISSKELDFGLR